MKKALVGFTIVCLLVTACQKDILKGYKSPERAILFYTVENQLGESVITRGTDSSTVIVTLPPSVDLKAVKPLITVSENASIAPASGEAIDFSTNKSHVYTVTSEDGHKREWMVRVEVSDVPLPGLVLIPNEGKWESYLKVYSDTNYNNYLTRYSGWNGADGCYSTLLPDGSLLWTFQDSFFGDVTPDRARVDNTFARNAGILQKDRSLTSFVQLNAGSGKNSETWIKYPGNTNNTDDLYWPGRTHVRDNKVQVPMGHMHLNAANGELEHASTDVAILSLPDLALENIVLNVDTTKSTGYDSGSFDDADGYSYMYGTENQWLSTILHVARVPNHDFTAKWEYLTDNGWADKPDGHSIASDITEPNVFKDGNKYYLVSQQIIYGQDIYIYESSSPIGPWTNKRTLYRIPDKYDGTDILTYNASVHPGLSQKGELVISYNINPRDFWSNFNNPGSADRYRPYFVRVFGWK